MKLRHPSKAVLRDWLTGEIEPDTTDTVERHLDTCARCAATLEALEPAPEVTPGPDSSLSSALAIVLAPPDDLARRLEEGVTARLSSRQMMEVVADLFGAGLETTRLLLIEGDDDDDS
ncbi:MAG: zf-HC2 domain-containing protein [Acidimicrobiales bacterium]